MDKTIMNDTDLDSSLSDLKNSISFEYCDFTNPEHLKALAELTNSYMADPMGDAEPLNKIKQLRLVDGLANHPTALIVFAVVDAKAVGLATCFVIFSTFNVKSYLYIHDFMVLSAYRGRGVGKALMEQLVCLSEERKYCKMTLEVRADNARAQALYQKFGFDSCDPAMLFWTKKIEL